MAIIKLTNNNIGVHELSHGNTSVLPNGVMQYQSSSNSTELKNNQNNEQNNNPPKMGFWENFGNSIKSIGATISSGMSKIFGTLGITSISDALSKLSEDLKQSVALSELKYSNPVAYQMQKEAHQLIASNDKTDSVFDTLATISKQSFNRLSDNIKHEISDITRFIQGNDTQQVANQNNDLSKTDHYNLKI